MIEEQIALTRSMSSVRIEPGRFRNSGFAQYWCSQISRGILALAKKIS